MPHCLGWRLCSAGAKYAVVVLDRICPEIPQSPEMTEICQSDGGRQNRSNDQLHCSQVAPAGQISGCNEKATPSEKKPGLPAKARQHGTKPGQEGPVSLDHQ